MTTIRIWRVVDVIDGVDMTAELLVGVFETFAQADQGLARSDGGLGLRLALTKGPAELHGRGAWATTAGPGQGATFSHGVPVGPPPSRP